MENPQLEFATTSPKACHGEEDFATKNTKQVKDQETNKPHTHMHQVNVIVGSGMEEEWLKKTNMFSYRDMVTSDTSKANEDVEAQSTVDFWMILRKKKV